MSSKARILVVEDDADLADCMQLKLNEFDYSVTAIALTGEEAIQKTAETRPDLVLMDIRLRGEMDGVEAARIIGERFDIPVIFVTGHFDEASVERAKRAEPYGYILKPFQHREIHISLELALSRHQQVKSAKDQLRALAARLVAVREDERKRIARDIHDELGQSLTTLKMDLALLEGNLAKGLEDNGEAAMETVKTMAKTVDATIGAVQKIGSDLRPAVLDEFGLVSAIAWQAQEFGRRTQIRCECSLPDEETDPGEGGSTALFRIFQETLTNVARHAQATEVNVSLEIGAGFLNLEVHDNGRGITPDEIADRKSLGLLGIRERAHQLGGEVKVSGAPGQGTIVAIRIPVNQKPGA